MDSVELLLLYVGPGPPGELYEEETDEGAGASAGVKPPLSQGASACQPRGSILKEGTSGQRNRRRC